MDHSAAVLPLQKPKDVSVAEIEQELSKVWSAKGDSAAARAATFNMVVYESLDDSLLFPSAPVEAIATQNPCRVIDLRSRRQGSEEDAVAAQVAAYCPVNRDRSSLVCCEYVTLQAPESAFVRMASTVAALLIPDLPAFLWWHGDLDLNSKLFQQLVGISNRVIVDSRTFINPEEDLGEMHQMIQEGKHCGDLNWLRLGSWQELAAQAFDPPDRRQVLRSVNRVTVDYKATNPCQAFLYLGWLASRLGWEPISRVESEEHDYLINRIRFVGPEQEPIEAEMAAVPIAAETTSAGNLIGLRLSSTESRADATILCSETTGCMRMESMGAAQSASIHQVAALENESLPRLLELQLQRLGPDRLYEESLAMAVRILLAKT